MRERKEFPFEKYNFKRKKYQVTDLPYQMGNNEMGGLAHLSGLGFHNLYFADVWDTEESRMALPGPLFSNDDITEEILRNADFKNELTLREGILTTEVNDVNKVSYKSEIFFSKENRHLLCMRITPLAGIGSDWYLHLPSKQFTYHSLKESLHGFFDSDESYSKISFALGTKNKYIIEADKRLRFPAAQNETIEIYYSVTTQFDGEDFINQSLENVNRDLDFSELKENLINYSAKEYNQIASVILPESEYAKWFYRAVFGLYNTSGSHHFLPAELQFSKPSPYWNGHPFTYGQGGWGIFAFTFLGAFDKAEKMAKWHYKPEVQKQNFKTLFPEKGEIDVYFKDEYKGKHTYVTEHNKDALAFGHELSADGYNIPISHTLGKHSMHWDWQRHLDSFASSFFHLLSKYSGNESFINTYTYPVLKGTAQMWCTLLKWDKEEHYWYLPPLLSVSENLLEKSVLDAIMGAKWNLKTAAFYAKKLNKDMDLADKWEKTALQIYIPQNDENYLEYLDDDERREGGGYFGIRAPMSLAFPYLELLNEVDTAKARKTLDKAWKRNNKGHGMITYVSNWFALTESYLGFKDQAFKMANFVLENIDPSGAAICEAFEYEDNDNKKGDWVPKFPYYLTGYSAFICATISFLIQSSNNRIKVFPCVPPHWKNIEFYDLPCEGGYKVSAKLTEGKTEWIEITKEGKKVLETQTNEVFIINQNNEISVQI